MATKVKKLTDELTTPTLPGTVNNNAVKTAATGVQNARNAVTNMTYDNFKSGDLYKGLQRDYQQQGQQAMKDTLGQVAARTGGMASSYATSAANQSYNNYMGALEEAARNMYNNEYARKRDAYDMARDEYNTAYGEYRDQVGDAWNRYDAERNAYENDRTYSEAAKLQAQEDVMAIWKSGNTPSPELLAAAGWADDTVNGGVVLNAAGKAYFAQQEQSDAYDEIYARIANGETLEQIAESYEQDGKAVDWKGLTGISEAEWRQIYNENEQSGYKNGEGIMKTLTDSASFTLDEKDQRNFDKEFGTGAYATLTEKVDQLIDSVPELLMEFAITGDRVDVDLFDKAATDWMDEVANLIPKITRDQLMDIMEARVPELVEWIEDPSKSLRYVDKSFVNGRWIQAKG